MLSKARLLLSCALVLFYQVTSIWAPSFPLDGSAKVDVSFPNIQVSSVLPFVNDPGVCQAVVLSNGASANSAIMGFFTYTTTQSGLLAYLPAQMGLMISTSTQVGLSVHIGFSISAYAIASIWNQSTDQVTCKYFIFLQSILSYLQRFIYTSSQLSWPPHIYHLYSFMTLTCLTKPKTTYEVCRLVKIHLLQGSIWSHDY
jgi:hypothetical protein